MLDEESKDESPVEESSPCGFHRRPKEASPAKLPASGNPVGFTHQLFPSFPEFYMEEASGGCAPCTDGTDYTNHSNTLPSCLPCMTCKSGPEPVVSVPAVRVLGDEMGLKRDEESET